MTTDADYQTIATDELARLRRIEEAARDLIDTWPRTRSATPLLSAMAALRAALNEKAAVNSDGPGP